MRKYIFGLVIVVVVAVVGYLAYRYFFQSGEVELLLCNQPCSDDGQCASGHCSDGFCRNNDCPSNIDCTCVLTDDGGTVVRGDFNEDFRDGELDDFWKFDNGGKEDNKYEVDYIKEQLVISAVGETSQWTNENTAPTMSFLTDQDFKLVVKFDFDPRQDFQHGGIGLFDDKTGDWIRISRTYDSHSLQDPGDQPNTVYVMQRSDEGVLKFDHDNFRDVRVSLSMKKKGENVIFEYSRDGEEWTYLDDIDLVDFSSKPRVYLFAYSTSQSPVEAIFKNIEFTVE